MKIRLFKIFFTLDFTLQVILMIRIKLHYSKTLTMYGRDRKIRTFDPQHPMLVRYHAALCPDL